MEVNEFPSQEEISVNVVGGYKVDRWVTQLLPENIVRRTKMLPIRVEGEQLYVATISPINLPAVDEIKLLTGLKVKPVIVSEQELSQAINSQFKAEQTSRQAIIDMTFQELGNPKVAPYQETITDVDQVPVVSLVNSIIRGAVNDGASDIHLEPQFPEMRVRYRINGILHNITTVPRYIESAIVSRIKLLADMDITEHRRPQDGHFSISVGRKQIDLRVSSAPTINGEKLVIRVLDKDTMFINVENLGMSDEQQKLFRSFISQPYGMILVTGPTGSGKTTTLYAALNEFDTDARNIITVENPVEYQMPGINQMQINPNIDWTFAKALRTIVRQDPDVIMVGEIRDVETADIAINAALTGHLVLSTLHTNDAPGAIIRLADMGIQPFLVSSSLIGVVAQRLIRTICPNCKEYYEPSTREIDILQIQDANLKLAKGKGCTYCHNTGYRGRTGIYEILEVDDEIRQLIIAKADANEIKRLAVKKGMKSLGQSAREKILQGVSTIEEVRRIVQINEE